MIKKEPPTRWFSCGLIKAGTYGLWYTGLVVIGLDDVGRRGIDGVYYNPNGNPPYIIAEAKYNTARLGNTVSDGKQMSERWIDRRLENAVGEERIAAIQDAMEFGDVQSHLFNIKQDGRIIVNQLDEMAKKMK